MALSIECPGCQSVYPVPESLIGKTIRCKNCSEMIEVAAPIEAAKPSRAAAVDDDESPRAKSSRRAAAADDDERPSPRGRRAAAAADDDEDDERPSRRGESKKKSPLPLILAGLAGLLVVGGGAAAVFMNKGGDQKGDVAAVTAPMGVANNEGTPPIEPTNEAPKTKSKGSSKSAPTKAAPEKKPTETTKTVDETPTAKAIDEAPVKDAPPMKEAPKAAPLAAAIVDDPPPLSRSGRGGSTSSGGMSDADYFNGVISPVNMDMVTKSSVFIRCETDYGGGEGSGWFGVAPGLVFTNAHVLNMKSPNAPEPKKLTFFLNAGTPQQREIPHAKLKILAVDHAIDLAVIQVIGETDLPTPLKVRPSAELKLGQSVFTVGYPLGSRMAGVVARAKVTPQVAVRKTAYSGNNADEFGATRRIKLEGGINPGNSGGPIIDARGEVTGVVVEMYGGEELGNRIGLGVPTEYVIGMMTGRIARVEYGVPYRDAGKVKIPVTAKVLNPLNKPFTAHIRGWVGDANDKFRPPMNDKPKSETADAGAMVADLKYDAKAQKATGEIVVPEAPAGRTYFGQPYYTYINDLGNNAIYALPGNKVPMSGSPVDRVAINLTAKPKEGQKRSVTLTNSFDKSESAEGEGEAKEDKIRLKTTLKLNEVVIAPDRTDQLQLARLEMKFEDWKLGVEGQGGWIDQDVLKEDQREQIVGLIKQAKSVARINKFGEMYAYTTGIPNLPPQLQTIGEVVKLLTNDSLEALQATSLPMPNKQVQPLETWTSEKDTRLTLISRQTPSLSLDGTQPKQQKPKIREYQFKDKVTYRYMGMRERAGKKEAVVEVEGKAAQAPGKKENVTGSVKGIAYVEIETGTVVEAEIEKEFTLDTSGDGKKRRFEGLNVYKISRGGSQ